jgi:hypothetical protein
LYVQPHKEDTVCNFLIIKSIDSGVRPACRTFSSRITADPYAIVIEKPRPISSTAFYCISSIRKHSQQHLDAANIDSLANYRKEIVSSLFDSIPIPQALAEVYSTHFPGGEIVGGLRGSVHGAEQQQWRGTQNQTDRAVK